jgi:hypothetical protein
MKCEYCGHNKFFVDTLGVEHCCKCFGPTMYFTEATGRLSFRQIDLEDELVEYRKKKGVIK